MFDCNSRNQLKQVATGSPGAEVGQGSHDYNYAGMRIRHLNSERGDIEYIYDGDSIIDEVQNNSTTLVAHYRYGDRLLSLNTGGADQYYHYASLGTTANLTNAQGEQQVAYRTGPFGDITQQEGESVNRQIFTGQEHDEKTGLIYFGARFYDPDTARFINQDSYLGESSTPPSLHRYLYAYANPTVYVDKDGHVAGLDETGQYLNDTAKQLLGNVQEDSGMFATAFYGFAAGANYFVGGVVETVNFGLNIAASTIDSDSMLGYVGDRARTEMDQAFGTIQHLTENKAEVATSIYNSVATNLGEAAAGNSKSQANIIATLTGVLGSKGQNSLLSANRTAAVVNGTKTVMNSINDSRLVVAATNTVERAVTAGGNQISALSKSAVNGYKQSYQKVTEIRQQLAQNVMKPGPGPMRRQIGAVGDVERIRPGNSSNQASLSQSLKYNVGTHGENKNLVRGKNTGLDSHHAGQKDIMKDLVADYDPKTAPAILVPRQGHTTADLELPLGRQTVSRLNVNPNTGLPFSNARDLIARDIRELRRVYSDIPNSKLQELVNLNKTKYPEITVKGE